MARDNRLYLDRTQYPPQPIIGNRTSTCTALCDAEKSPSVNLEKCENISPLIVEQCEILEEIIERKMEFMDFRMSHE